MICRLQSAAILALLAAASCTEALAPTNTDVGLFVWAEVTPAVLSIKDSTTQVRVRLNVRNPSGREIRVRSGGPPYVFTGDPAKSKGLWGSLRFGCSEQPLHCGPRTDWGGDSVYVIAARRTVQEEATFTLKSWADGGWPLTVRAYHVRAWFNAREGDSATLNIIP